MASPLLTYNEVTSVKTYLMMQIWQKLLNFFILISKISSAKVKYLVK